MLSYLLALVYYEREDSERAELQDRIENSVNTDEERREFSAMGKTYAQVLMEKGAAEGEVRALRRNLARLLEQHFAPVPTGVVTKINDTGDLAQLESWLDRFATAETLEDVGILDG